MVEIKKEISDYITYTREFEKYTWYKPLIVLILTIIFLFIFNGIMFIIGEMVFGEQFIHSLAGNYESLNTINAGTLFSFISIFFIVPSLFIANKIVGYRPFSSYASSRGGWDWKLYFKCFLISFVIYIVFTVISVSLNPNAKFNNQFTVWTFIIFLIAIPLQCIAEEFGFRGLIMQTIGGWTNVPVVAIVIQAIIFGLAHPYSSLGVISIVITGLAFGFLAWKSNGLETNSAIHSVNNLFSIMVAGFGLSHVSSTVSLTDALSDIGLSIVCVAVIYFIGKKYGWFGESS